MHPGRRIASFAVCQRVKSPEGEQLACVGVYDTVAGQLRSKSKSLRSKFASARQKLHLATEQKLSEHAVENVNLILTVPGFFGILRAGGA